MIGLELIDIPRKPGRVKVSPTQRAALLRRQCQQCAFCGRRTHLEAHHIRRVVNGGPSELWNLIGLCRRCHRALDAAYEIAPVTRLALAFQMLAPESRFVAAICWFLFVVFHRSRLDTSRYVTFRTEPVVDYYCERLSATEIGSSY